MHCAKRAGSRFIANAGAGHIGYIVLPRWIAAKCLREHVRDEIAHSEYGDDDPADPKGLTNGEEAVEEKEYRKLISK